MSKKSELIAIFNKIDDTAKRAFNSSYKVVHDGMYSPEGIKQELNRLTKLYSEQIQTMRQQAMDSIDAGLQGLESKWKEEVL